MDYLNNLLSLFVTLFGYATHFTMYIALVIVSGLVGGLVKLFKRLLSPARRNNE